MKDKKSHKKYQMAVATHKLYKFPEDALYLPVQAGRALHEPFLYVGDDTGDNISHKNDTYCELTVLYWAWKNLDADYIGLCHYRRFLGTKRIGRKCSRILTGRQARRLFQRTDVLLPKKRNYFIETNYSQYIHAHHREDLEAVREILKEDHPEYLEAFLRYMRNTKGHHFNLFFMKREILDAYCSWLFEVLSKLEDRLDITGYDEYNRRVFGFVGERLLDTWLDTNHISYVELPVIHTENQHWIRKGTAFLWRKFRAEGTDHGGRYFDSRI